MTNGKLSMERPKPQAQDKPQEKPTTVPVIAPQDEPTDDDTDALSISGLGEEEETGEELEQPEGDKPTGDEEGSDAEKELRSGMAQDDMETARVDRYVQVLNKDTELTRVFKATIEADELAAKGSGFYLVRVNADFPRGGDLWNALPKMGTTKGDKDAAGNLINNYDRWKEGNARTYSSFYGRMFDRWEQGSELSSVVRQLKLADNPDTRANALEPYRSMNQDKRKTELGLFAQRLNRSRRRFIAAWTAMFRLDEIEDKLGDKVEVEFPASLVDVRKGAGASIITVRDGTTTQVKNKAGETILKYRYPDNVEHFTVEQFNGLNVDWAIANGNNWQALVTSITPKARAEIKKARTAAQQPNEPGQREPQETGSQETAANKAEASLTLATMPAVLGKLALVLDGIDAEAENRAAFLKQVQAPQGEALALHLTQVWQRIDHWRKMYPAFAQLGDKLDKEYGSPAAQQERMRKAS